jgi:epoxyqueuosine reductase
VALGNVGTREDLQVLNILALDDDPLIAEHASWAVEQIRNRSDFIGTCVSLQTD